MQHSHAENPSLVAWRPLTRAGLQGSDNQSAPPRALYFCTQDHLLDPPLRRAIAWLPSMADAIVNFAGLFKATKKGHVHLPALRTRIPHWTGIVMPFLAILLAVAQFIFGTISATTFEYDSLGDNFPRLTAKL